MTGIGAPVVQALTSLEGLQMSPLFLCLDVREEAQVQHCVEDVHQLLGLIDVLVNAAGVTSLGNITATSAEEWCRVLEINLTSSILTSEHALLAMLAQHGSSIINIGSIFGKQGGASQSGFPRLFPRTWPTSHCRTRLLDPMQLSAADKVKGMLRSGLCLS